MPTEGWRFNSITREVVRGGAGSPVLMVATPGDSIRSMPLDAKDLARLIKEAAVQLEVEIREGRASEGKA